MKLNSQDKVALFIDGANLYATSRSLGFDIDYKRLLSFFEKRSRLLRAYYYTPMSEDQEFSTVRPLIDWLDYNGYRVITKPIREYLEAGGRRKARVGIEVDLAVDALEISPFINHAVIFSGDGDFKPLVGAMQRRGVFVTVVSSISSQPAMIADELRRQADQFYDLGRIADEISRSHDDRSSIGWLQTNPGGDEFDADDQHDED